MDVDNRLTYISVIGVEGVIDGVEGVIIVDVWDFISDIGVEGAVDADNRVTCIFDSGIGVEAATDGLDCATLVDVECNECIPNPLLTFGLLRSCITEYSTIS